MKQFKTLSFVDKAFIILLLVIFGGIVLHAPLTVGLQTLFPAYELWFKSWKEILMLIAMVLAGYLLYKHKQTKVVRQPLILLIAAYALLHIILLPFMFQGATESLAGLIIDLHYLLFFVLVYFAIKLYPTLRRPFLYVGIAGALVVTLFGLLQVTVLPNDILKYLGYNNSTIAPYLTVDQNDSFIRINSTLRGPNPLGAYVGIVLTLMTAYLARRKLSKLPKPQIIAAVITAASLVCLWASYSRSALIAAVIGIGLVLVIIFGRRISRRAWIITGLAVVALIVGLIIGRNNSFVSNVLLHENLNGGSDISSNEGHVSSLENAFTQMLHHPFGGGIGSTGSASLYGNSPEIIENQYLFVAHEVGWVGLIVFINIYVWVVLQAWQRRKDWLALGVFASGIGLAVIGLLLPVWVDDTVSIIWWGLAAIAIGGKVEKKQL